MVGWIASLDICVLGTFVFIVDRGKLEELGTLKLGIVDESVFLSNELVIKAELEMLDDEINDPLDVICNPPFEVDSTKDMVDDLVITLVTDLLAATTVVGISANDDPLDIMCNSLFEVTIVSSIIMVDQMVECLTYHLV